MFVENFLPDESWVFDKNTGIMKFQQKSHESFDVFIENQFKQFQFANVEIDKVERMEKNGTDQGV